MALSLSSNSLSLSLSLLSHNPRTRISRTTTPHPLLPRSIANPFFLSWNPRSRLPSSSSSSSLSIAAAAAEGPSYFYKGPSSSSSEEDGDVDKPSSDIEVEPESPPVAAGGPGIITDEWGEKGEPVAEPPSEADPPTDEGVQDEWGKDQVSSAAGTDEYLASGNGSAGGQYEEEEEGVEDELEDLKRCLVDTFYGMELGLRASAEVRAEVLELVNQLEAANPTPAPNDAPELLDGCWVLLYTAFSELLPLIAIGEAPFLKVKRITQVIDTRSCSIVNATTISSPFASFSFRASASFEVRTSSRIQVQFKEGIFEPPVISSTADLPESVDLFGQRINLSPLQNVLNPVQEAAANITRVISGQPPLKIPIPGERTASWLLTTYLDKDLRISRGDGGLFVLAKEGSPLLDQL